MKKLTKTSLDKLCETARDKNATNWIKVGMSTCGVAAGADEVYATLLDEIKRLKLNVEVKKTGCLGACSVEPLVEVNVEGVHHVVYARINKQAALGIVEKHLCQKRLMNDHIVAIKQDKAQC